MDWGVAKVWGMPQEEPLNISATDLETHRLTITGSRPGTPLYMSPEQIRGTPPVDERSDIFSFGVLLYECLVHQEPFRGKDINETFENILRNTPPPPSTLSKQLKKVPLLDAICEKALRKHAADRYQTVGELIDALIQGRSDLLKSLSDTRSR